VNCDSIAGWYRRIEHIGFGSALERRRNAFLGEVCDARRILVLGEGDGRFLVRLLEQTLQEQTGVEVDYLDLSRRMLELARARLEAAGHGGGSVTFRQGDALIVPLPRAEYDLIVTHFFLDCFNEADAATLVQNIAEAARPHARWLISEFHQPEGGWRATWAWLWLRILYAFFRVTTGLQTSRLIDHHPLLLRSGFRLSRAETAHFGLLVSELWTR
jgi:ubiquinone/menaquinone biosynthesis C-methylase UbiE